MTEPAQPVVRVIPEAPRLPHRLGRHLHHDPQSRRFAFRATVFGGLKPVRWERAVPIMDQGDLGSCTGNAAASWLGTANSLRAGMDVAPDPKFRGGLPVAVNEALARDLYSEATDVDPYDGSWPPTDTGSDGLSVTKVLLAIGAVDSYQHAFDTASVLAALQLGPVLIGTEWREDMFTPDGDGLVRPTGQVVGGHEYLAVGYEPAGSGPVPHSDVVVFANSWGPSFGDAGYFRMTVDTLTVLLAADGDATIPHAVVAAPAPTPSPAPPAPAPVDPAQGAWFPDDRQRAALTRTGARFHPPRTWQEQVSHEVDAVHHIHRGQGPSPLS